MYNDKCRYMYASLHVYMYHYMYFHVSFKCVEVGIVSLASMSLGPPGVALIFMVSLAIAQRLH